jgi:hypothetical protein
VVLQQDGDSIEKQGPATHHRDAKIEVLQRTRLEACKQGVQEVGAGRGLYRTRDHPVEEESGEKHHRERSGSGQLERPAVRAHGAERRTGERHQQGTGDRQP